MNKFSKTIAAAGLIIAAASFPAGAGQYDGPGFSGEMWIDTGKDSYERIGPIYVDKIGFRMERRFLGGPLVVTLVTWDAPVNFNLRPDMGVYWEEPNKTDTGFADEPCNDYENGEKLDLETVNGRNAEKWRCTGQILAPSGVPVDVTRWYDRELNFMVREVTDKGNMFEIRNRDQGMPPVRRRSGRLSRRIPPV